MNDHKKILGDIANEYEQHLKDYRKWVKQGKRHRRVIPDEYREFQARADATHQLEMSKIKDRINSIKYALAIIAKESK
jgi:hypothetical protein